MWILPFLIGLAATTLMRNPPWDCRRTDLKLKTNFFLEDFSLISTFTFIGLEFGKNNFLKDFLSLFLSLSLILNDDLEQIFFKGFFFLYYIHFH